MSNCSRRLFLQGIGASLLTLAPSVGFSKINKVTDKPIRYGMLHDENLCIGCTACMDACREVNHVPEGVTRLEIIRTGPYGEFPDISYRFFRHSCQHCTNAPCVAVCPTGASYIDIKNGIVDVNPDLCVGCQYCIAVCPYRVRYINPVTLTADKCNFCRNTNLAKGKLPACVEACPTKALTFGDLNDPYSAISLKLKEKVTYRTKVALGTEPNLYHVPNFIGEIHE
ncbi:cytochrome c nitrite reductase Fe-S protein [Actinobacillus delphinicola]|uniref:cytochrome c nitrite reductase Fe-S protein n=1 Tax=Actinobacillus delphinicola TaxID=51161 RepID=UPI0024410462|nr:cytochrome c nitrite reductase Fe-S protein [Actinobacillus delphinicola]MDG6897834.1 cytochrome c nitrite reductase Fe-S protein [Actinobacillus delphinicola]